MDKPEITDIASLLVDKLWGKFTLLQSQEDREDVISAMISEATGSDHKERLKKEIEKLNNSEERTRFIKEFLSYGMIEDLLFDSDIEDIIINSLNNIYVHHSQKGLVSTNKKFRSQKELDLFVKKLLLFAGKSEMKKIINLELPNLEGRVNIVLSPFGPQITITKAKVEPLSIVDLIKKDTLSCEVAAQLWLYIEGLSLKPANIIIAGGPGTGKTTLLNALFSFVPVNERMVIIEDTMELNTFLEESCSRLESDDDISLAHLVKNSLRMRPDRIVVGEVRGDEARDMITAVNVGKYCLGTIHASTAREAILRLQNEPMNVPEIMVNLVDVFIIMKRFHVHDKVYRVVEEVSETGGMEQRVILLSQIFKYDYERKAIRGVSTSTVYRDRLAKIAGVTPKDIIDEVYLRTAILKILLEKDIHTMKEVTVFCRTYNRKPEEALANLGLSRQEILKGRR
ncbi:MAG TPA: ATPase, T2SS/T4P/T4SS family [Candidatus Omnitrophota bacterium]|nr:ATPase, T2SS/T4P/T4SS family [Candidatus Omnitrophota bacterium]HPD85659.1 ATPase, T2SS/T4P/T4SS family [Candidatus Omnitrophota bacterium]HRZ04502.1 ATPase, T2SS/T4P/T4SS family [Candidatus Omnitrophota bacterium]